MASSFDPGRGPAPTAPAVPPRLAACGHNPAACPRTDARSPAPIAVRPARARVSADCRRIADRTATAWTPRALLFRHSFRPAGAGVGITPRPRGHRAAVTGATAWRRCPPLAAPRDRSALCRSRSLDAEHFVPAAYADAYRRPAPRSRSTNPSTANTRPPAISPASTAMTYHRAAPASPGTSSSCTAAAKMSWVLAP